MWTDFMSSDRIGEKYKEMEGSLKKMKKRGFVMTGGGAKGLYEAGVIHAFHITGIEFDVITGSSIGAMDPLIKAYHHAWLLPDKRLIDDTPKGPLGRLKDDLLYFNLNLPDITEFGWWWTDPQRGVIHEPKIGWAVTKLLCGLVKRLVGLGVLLRIFKDHRKSPIQEVIRTYLARFGMARAIIPPGEDNKIRTFA
jgi:hypothetical protein